MSHDERPSYDSDLRRLRPARAPAAFVDRLQEAVRMEASPVLRPVPASAAGSTGLAWRTWLKWLVPVAGGAAALALVLIVGQKPNPAAPAGVQKPQPRMIDEVELDQQLVAAYEGVAELPGGLPLLFRCYGWQEQLTLRDTSGAIEVEQRGPRFEIVPVGLDVY